MDAQTTEWTCVGEQDIYLVSENLHLLLTKGKLHWRNEADQGVNVNITS